MLLTRPVLLLKWILLIPTIIANANPPEEPVKCSNKLMNCTITNSYGAFPDRSICRAAEVAYPSSEEELVSVVANATQANRKMRVATRYSHSIPKLVCPDGDNGLIISTENLNSVINIDQEKMLVTLESGVTLMQLINEAAKSGLALPYSPYWWGLTIGGLLGTGAHGSTLWGEGSAIHNYVVRMRIVTPSGPGENYAKVRTLEDNGDFDGDMKAAKVSLGVLGVISQVY